MSIIECELRNVIKNVVICMHSIIISFQEPSNVIFTDYSYSLIKKVQVKTRQARVESHYHCMHLQLSPTAPIRKVANEITREKFNWFGYTLVPRPRLTTRKGLVTFFVCADSAVSVYYVAVHALHKITL